MHNVWAHMLFFVLASTSLILACQQQNVQHTATPNWMTLSCLNNMWKYYKVMQLKPLHVQNSDMLKATCRHIWHYLCCLSITTRTIRSTQTHAAKTQCLSWHRVHTRLDMPHTENNRMKLFQVFLMHCSEQKGTAFGSCEVNCSEFWCWVMPDC